MDGNEPHPFHFYDILRPQVQRHVDLSNARAAADPDMGKLRRKGGCSVQVGVDGGKVHSGKDAVGKIPANKIAFEILLTLR